MKQAAAARRGRSAAREFAAVAAAAGIEALRGKAALHAHAAAVDCTAAWSFSGSVDLDAAFAASQPDAPRWDAGIGLHRTGADADALIVWIEPHPASSTGHVAEMLHKLDWLKAKLKSAEFAGLRRLTEAAERRGRAYRWLARTGAIRIRPNSREHRLLIKAGLTMPARHLTVP